LQSLNYTVISAYNKKETLYLLKDVTGYFKPRQMTALVSFICHWFWTAHWPLSNVSRNCRLELCRTAMSRVSAGRPCTQFNRGPHSAQTAVAAA
jgi:hypothetical protein